MCGPANRGLPAVGFTGLFPQAVFRVTLGATPACPETTGAEDAGHRPMTVALRHFMGNGAPGRLRGRAVSWTGRGNAVRSIPVKALRTEVSAGHARGVSGVPEIKGHGSAGHRPGAVAFVVSGTTTRKKVDPLRT